MRLTLKWVCRVVGSSKLFKLNVFESLPKELKVSRNSQNRKLFISYFQKNGNVVGRCNLTKSTFLKVYQNR